MFSMFRLIWKILENVIKELNSQCDLLQQENQQLKEQLHKCSIEIQELCEKDIECPSYCDKLKQRDEVIDEAISLIQNILKFPESFSGKDNVGDLLEILNKYKGDSNGNK